LIRLRSVAQEQKGHLVLLLMLTLAAALRLYGLATESFWFDEAYSVWVARHSVGWHIALSTQRIFPPLYYLCLHFWLKLGSSEFWVRALSVLIGVVSIAAIYVLGKQLFDKWVGLLSAFLLTISPLHIWYSQEARMYILVAALSLYSAIFMLLALREGKFWQWLAYVLTTALLMNAHYFAVFLVPFQNVYALYRLLRERAQRGIWMQWVFSQLMVGLLSVIGLAGIFSTESGYWWGLLDTWHGAPGLADLLGLMFSFSLGTTVRGRLVYWGGLLIFGSCILGNLLTFVRGRSSPSAHRDPRVSSERDGLVFVLLYLLIPVGTVFALSQVRSFWVLRYIFPFLPPYCILVGRGIARMLRLGERRFRSVGLALGSLMLAAVSLISFWPIVNMYRYEQKENWRAAVQYISAEERFSDIIFLVDEDIWLPFEHYYRGSVRRVGVSRVLTDPALLAARVGMILPSYERIWLVLSHTDNLALKDQLRTLRYARLVSEETFTGIEVDLFAIQYPIAERD